MYIINIIFINIHHYFVIYMRCRLKYASYIYIFLQNLQLYHTLHIISYTELALRLQVCVVLILTWSYIQWSILCAEAVEALGCACVMQRTGKANSVAGLSSMLGTTASLAARQKKENVNPGYPLTEIATLMCKFEPRYHCPSWEASRPVS